MFVHTNNYFGNSFENISTLQFKLWKAETVATGIFAASECEAKVDFLI
jgi:hypothetical protein